MSAAFIEESYCWQYSTLLTQYDIKTRTTTLIFLEIIFSVWNHMMFTLSVFLTILVLFVPCGCETQEKLGSHVCYTHYAEVQTVPILRFFIPNTNNNTCEDYCQYMDQCEAFSFQINKPNQCAIYKETQGEILLSIEFKSLSILGFKACITDDLNPNVTGVVSLSQRKGLILQKLITKECLTRGEPLDNIPGYKLVWSYGCSKPLIWIMAFKKNEDYFGNFIVVIKDKESNMCLSASHVYTSHPNAVLANCGGEKVFDWDEPKAGNKGPPRNENKVTQALVLSPDDIHDNSWSIRQYLPTYVLINAATKYFTLEGATGNVNTALQQLDFVTQEEIGNLPCDYILVRNGRAAPPAPQGVSIYLPGELVNVVCDDGYGRTSDNETFETTFIVTCQSYMEPIMCVPIPPASKKNPENCAKHPVVVKESGKESTSLEMVKDRVEVNETVSSGVKETLRFGDKKLGLFPCVHLFLIVSCITI